LNRDRRASALWIGFRGRAGDWRRPAAGFGAVDEHDRWGVAGEGDVDDPGELQSTAPGQFALVKAGFQEDHHGLSAIVRGWHPRGVVYHHPASS
jgi:hypothetical protein